MKRHAWGRGGGCGRGGPSGRQAHAHLPACPCAAPCAGAPNQCSGHALPAAPAAVPWWRVTGSAAAAAAAHGNLHSSPPPLDCAHQVTRWLSTCGNAVVEGDEECDDGDLSDGDGCSSTCRVEKGWHCKGSPSKCTRKPVGGGGGGCTSQQPSHCLLRGEAVALLGQPLQVQKGEAGGWMGYGLCRHIHSSAAL